MRNTLGFTLIELVIVIVILGVLSITAAPRFLNLQSDARKASLEGFIATYKTSEEIIEGKANIEGKDFESATEIEVGEAKVKIKYGSISPKISNIIKAMDVDGFKLVEFEKAEQLIILPNSYTGKTGSVSLEDYNKALQTNCYIGINAGKESNLRTDFVRNTHEC